MRAPLVLPECPSVEDLADFCRRAQARDKALTSVETALHLRALLGLDRWEEVLEHGYEALERFPGDPDLYALVGKALFRAGHLAACGRHLEACADLAANSVGLALEQMRWWQGRGDKNRARAALAVVEAHDYRTPEALLALGQAALFDGASERGAALLRAFMDGSSDIHPLIYARETVPALLELSRVLRGPLLPGPQWSEMPTSVPLTVERGLVFVPVCVVGQGPYEFLLDTGGSMFISLAESLFWELDIPVRTSVPLYGIGGRQEQNTVVGVAAGVSVGGLTLAEVPVFCLPLLDQLAAHLGRPVRGIFSPAVLPNAVIALERQAARLTLDVGGSPEGRRLRPGEGRHWCEGEVHTLTVPFFSLQDGKIAVPLVLAGRERWFVLDSGAEKSLLSRRLFEEVVPPEQITRQEIESMGIGSEADKGELLLTPELPFQLAGRKLAFRPGMTLDNVDKLLSPRLDCAIGGIVGQDVLGGFDRFVIDYVNMTVTLETSTDPDDEGRPAGNRNTRPG
jgi:hypothetical protein